MLKDLAQVVKGLAGPERTVLQKRLGEVAVTQASLGVRYGRDPYGNPWAELTSRNGRPLRRTGNNIQRSWTAQHETPDSFVFGSRFKYLATHQYGATIKPVRAKMLRFWVQGASASENIREASRTTRTGRVVQGRILVRKGEATQMNLVYARSVKIPRRQMVPEQKTGGLGKRWMSAFERTTRRYLKELFAKVE